MVLLPSGPRQPGEPLGVSIGSQLLYVSLRILVAVARVLYALFKLLPEQDRVVFLSRQTNEPPEDFLALAASIKNRPGGRDSIILARTIERGFVSRASYVAHLVRQMYYLATSRFVVLDSYSIAVSILNHRDSLRIVQIWHALGSFKKFGLSALMEGSLRRRRTAEILQMHRGYDTVVVSAPAAIGPFAEAMGIRRDQVEICPLPRVDDLTNPQWLSETRQDIFAAHPELIAQKIALWAPTLRAKNVGRRERIRLELLRETLANIGYLLVEAPHPLDAHFASDFRDDQTQFSTHQWLAASDVFLTDQSSLLIDAVILGLGVYLYVDDSRLEEVCETSYIDREMLSALAVADPEDIARRIANDETHVALGRTLRNTFIQMPVSGLCTDTMADIVLHEHRTVTTGALSALGDPPPRMEATIGIVTVTYNSTLVLEAFLASCAGEADAPTDIVVVDNGSLDIVETRRMCALYSARLIESPTNLGYGAALNLGVRMLAPDIECVILVNPDVVFSQGALAQLFTALQHDASAGLVGPRILDGEGNIYPSARPLPGLSTGIGHALFFRIWPRNPWSKAYRVDLSTVGSMTQTGWLSGACLGVRRSIFTSVQGFDEEFFMYFEDVDLGQRISEKGYRNLYIPASVITHTGAHSTDQSRSRMSKIHHESALRYIDKKYRSPGVWPLREILKIGLRLRAKVTVWTEI